ncbi:MAG: alanine:cation symporter family protein [Clostridiales Family XIII bacterium]|nr:alanine:cation symporter family protein [Clostridiales Family XIII bacterium]
MNGILDAANTWLYSYVLIALLILAGLFFTLRNGFVQIRLFPDAVRRIVDRNENAATVSSFQALMISTASRVGVGNIAGVATAIAGGGPGAVFWMWLIAVIGSASAFVESLLAQVYKVRDGEGFRGGPAYYIQRALGQRWLGIIFALCLIACFAYGFNTLQANTITAAFAHYFGDSTLYHVIMGLVLAGATAFVILGGQKKIAFMTSVIVPIMAVLYIILGLITLARNFSAVPSVFSMIFDGAFDFQSIFGGFAGSAIMLGVKRGLFSNEAGMGSAPNAAAAATVSHPAKQGLVQMLSVFIDTILICSTSAFLILLSGVRTEGMEAMPLVQAAIQSQFGDTGILLITVSVFLFAFSSIIGNYYYTESNMIFIRGKSSSFIVFRATVIIAVFLGALAGYNLAWNLADVLMGVMTVVNVVAILLLNGTANRVLRDYSRQKKAGLDPVFVAPEVGIHNTDLWKKAGDY